MALEAATEELETTADLSAEVEIPAGQTQSVAADVTSGGVDAGSNGAEVPDSGIDEELKQLAEVYGYNLDQSDPKGFVKHLAATFDRELSQLGRGGQTQQSQQASNGQSVQQQTSAAQAGLDLEKLVGELFPEAEIDPALRKGIHSLAAKLNEHHNQELTALETKLGKAVQDRLGQMEGYLQTQEDQRISQQLDGFFSALGTEWEGEFGKGAVNGMSPHSLQLKNRNAVVEDAKYLRDSFLLRGQQPPPLDTLLKRSLHARYADQHTTFVRKQIVHEAAQKKSQAAQAASKKRSAPPEGRDLAEHKWVEGLKKLGIKEHDGDD